jgi:hypothetical protein
MDGKWAASDTRRDLGMDAVSPDFWGTLTVAIASFSAIVVESYRTRQKLKIVEKSSAEAVRLSEPTGNGFAKSVLSALNRIEQRQDGQAGQQLRLANELSLLSTRTDTLSERLSGFIDRAGMRE